jgi:DNA-binding NtrC family response regulator
MGKDELRDRTVPGSLLIVEDDRRTAGELSTFLASEYETATVFTGDDAVDWARKHEVAAALVDLDLGPGRMDGFEVIRALRQLDPRTAILIVTSDKTEESIRRAAELEVQDYIEKSTSAQELLRTVRRALVLRRVSERVRRLEQERAGQGGLLVARSPGMHTVVQEVEQAARHRAPVLITGPVGAGKMVVAQQIHALAHPSRPFERVHGANLDTDLADSQLFGYEPGAFSGATSRFIGAIERAEDGTLLLDDIDYLPLRVQSKLLQPLEERIIRRLPGGVEVPIRCRVLATTNKELDALARQGAFRPDLLSRLCGGQVIRVPGIRERADDLADLARRMALESARESGQRLEPLDHRFLEAVAVVPWQDVRQLSNAIRYAVGICDGGVLTASCLPKLGAWQSPTSASATPSGDLTLDGRLEDTLSRVRALAVQESVSRCGGDKNAAAARLGITVQWLNVIQRRSRAGDQGAVD